MCIDGNNAEPIEVQKRGNHAIARVLLNPLTLNRERLGAPRQ